MAKQIPHIIIIIVLIFLFYWQQKRTSKKEKHSLPKDDNFNLKYNNIRDSAMQEYGIDGLQKLLNELDGLKKEFPKRVEIIHSLSRQIKNKIERKKNLKK